MKEYKYVSLQNVVVVNKLQSDDERIKNYFDVISEESVDGWEFVGIAPINVIQKKSSKNQKSLNTFIFHNSFPCFDVLSIS